MATTFGLHLLPLTNASWMSLHPHWMLVFSHTVSHTQLPLSFYFREPALDAFSTCVKSEFSSSEDSYHKKVSCNLANPQKSNHHKASAFLSSSQKKAKILYSIGCYCCWLYHLDQPCSLSYFHSSPWNSSVVSFKQKCVSSPSLIAKSLNQVLFLQLCWQVLYSLKKVCVFFSINL